MNSYPTIFIMVPQLKCVCKGGDILHFNGVAPIGISICIGVASCLLNQWVNFDQTHKDTSFGWKKEVIRLTFKVTRALRMFSFEKKNAACLHPVS